MGGRNTTLHALPRPAPDPAIVWIDDLAPPAEVAAELGGPSLAWVRRSEATAERLARLGPAVLCLGPEVSPADIGELLTDCDRREGHPPFLMVVLQRDPSAAALAPLLEDERLYYLCSPDLPAEDLGGLLASAAEELTRRELPRSPPGAPAALTGARHLQHLRRLAAATGPKEAGAALGQLVAAALPAERAELLLFDPAAGSLAALGQPELGHSAAAGLTSYALRTGRALVRERAGEDPRYDRELDNPEGGPRDRFLAVPLADGDGAVRAVLTALRGESDPAFTARDTAALEELARGAQPFLLPWLRGGDEPGAERGPFRPRALAERENPAGRGLAPLRLSFGWTRWAYWLVLAAFAASLLALLVVRVPEYAAGVAVLRTSGRSEVVARARGAITEVAVRAGDRVEAGDLLLTLNRGEESASLERLERQLEAKLIQRLQAPDDAAVGEGLIQLRAERAVAAARFAERELRAPSAGVVTDLRAAVGQYLEAGEPVLAIAASAAPPTVTALLPGDVLPQLSAGMRLRLEVPGARYSYQWLEVATVASEVIGPAEARRLLGPVAGDSIALAGPLAVVTATLPSSTLEIDGKSVPVRDGLSSRAEVELSSERLLFTLLPALKAAFGGADG